MTQLLKMSTLLGAVYWRNYFLFVSLCSRMKMLFYMGPCERHFCFLHTCNTLTPTCNTNRHRSQQIKHPTATLIFKSLSVPGIWGAGATEGIGAVPPTAHSKRSVTKGLYPWPSTMLWLMSLSLDKLWCKLSWLAQLTSLLSVIGCRIFFRGVTQTANCFNVKLLKTSSKEILLLGLEAWFLVLNKERPIATLRTFYFLSWRGFWLSFAVLVETLRLKCQSLLHCLCPGWTTLIEPERTGSEQHVAGSACWAVLIPLDSQASFRVCF